MDFVAPKKSAEYIYQTINTNDVNSFIILKNSKHYIWLGEERDELY
ncbi:hypothetical protein KHA80_13700 [Anaerobacillus sp. HL2]|nr:hypothetical protein KHA80_13700 [Anaerobacillus sp. HL2]